MKNDTVLKEKLNSLDTLSAGIVFGKEALNNHTVNLFFEGSINLSPSQ